MKSPDIETNTGLSTKARELYEQDRLLDAAKILRQINPSSALTAQELKIVQNACEYEKFFSSFTNTSASNSSGKDMFATWTSLGERNLNGYLTDVRYLLTRDESSSIDFTLDMKVDTLLHDKSLVSPLLALLNESDLYSTWLPSWDIPKISISQSKQLQQTGRCSQVVQMLVELPWPMSALEFILDGVAVDNVSSTEDPNIAIRLQTIHTGDKDGLILPPENSVVRVEFNGGFLFHRPESLPEYLKSAKEKGIISDEDENNPDDFLVLSFLYKYENKGSYYPEFLIRFGIQIGAIFGWGRFLKVAEQVRDGERPEHSTRIQSKREELYDWVEERVNVLCASSSTVTRT